MTGIDNNNNSKGAVAASYMNEMRELHAGKPMAYSRAAYIVGSDDDTTNIGNAIQQNLFEREDDSLVGLFYQESDRDIINNTDFFCDPSADILVLANGFTHLDWIENQPEDKIQKVISDCLTASIIATKRFVEATINSPHKKYIVYIGSMAYKGVLNGSSPYCAAKAGLSHFMKCVAWELAPKGYNVFCVNPSNTENTPMAEATIQGLMRYRNITEEEARKYWASCLPKDKWLQKEEIAEVVAFLISGKADYLSGSNIDLAGGQR